MLCVLAVLPVAPASALVAETVGAALDPESKALLYSETHCVSTDGLTREVLYRDAGGQLLAYKILSYETGLMTPSFEQRNLYANDSVAVEWQRDELVITANDNADKSRASSVSIAPSADSPLVIDAGFDAFVIANWDSLVQGQDKRFQFPVAARETLVELRIESAPCRYDTQTDQCFRLEVDNWLLSMVVDAIELGYDKRMRRLTRFRGVSNISDASGAGQVVDIHYTYQDLADQQCDEKQ